MNTSALLKKSPKKAIFEALSYDLDITYYSYENGLELSWKEADYAIIEPSNGLKNEGDAVLFGMAAQHQLTLWGNVADIQAPDGFAFYIEAYKKK